jgi:hypothetical protein
VTARIRNRARGYPEPNAAGMPERRPAWGEDALAEPVLAEMAETLPNDDPSPASRSAYRARFSSLTPSRERPSPIRS